MVLPDACAVIATLDDPTLPPVESAIFFEWHRSTESPNILRGKATGYYGLHACSHVLRFID